MKATKHDSRELPATGPRLGLSSGALYPWAPTEEAPAIAGGWGLADVEIMLQTAGEYSPAVITAIRARAAAVGVRIHAVHAFTQLHPLFNVYPRRAAEGRTLFSRGIAATAELGAGVLVWHGPLHGVVAWPDDEARVLALLAELAAECERAGVTLAIENVARGVFATARAVTSLAARLPELAAAGRLGFAFDPFQAAEAGANPFMVLAAMGDRVVDVHLSDQRPDTPATRHLPPGDGTLPWPALLRAVAAVYAGPLILEPPLDAAGRTLARVRALLDPLLTDLGNRGIPDHCAGPPPPGLLEGIALFNDRRFYECHEVIEHEWHAERGEIRHLYQGILQIGVGFHHARNGNHRGAVLLLTDGIAKTSRFLPRCLGIDTARLVRESQACLDQIIAAGLAALDWAAVPRIQGEALGVRR